MVAATFLLIARTRMEVLISDINNCCDLQYICSCIENQGVEWVRFGLLKGNAKTTSFLHLQSSSVSMDKKSMPAKFQALWILHTN